MKDKDAGAEARLEVESRDGGGMDSSADAAKVFSVAEKLVDKTMQRI